MGRMDATVCKFRFKTVLGRQEQGQKGGGRGDDGLESVEIKSRMWLPASDCGVYKGSSTPTQTDLAFYVPPHRRGSGGATFRHAQMLFPLKPSGIIFLKVPSWRTKHPLPIWATSPLSLQT